jgi:hypothetical protein
MNFRKGESSFPYKVCQPKGLLDLQTGRLGMGRKLLLLQPGKKGKVYLFSLPNFFKYKPFKINIIELSNYHDPSGNPLLDLDHYSMGELPPYQDTLNPRMASHLCLYPCGVDLPDIHPVT